MVISGRSEILLFFILDAARSLGYEDLREQQKDAVLGFLEGNDVFIALPIATGYRVLRAYLEL